jgi:hypothetical protein
MTIQDSQIQSGSGNHTNMTFGYMVFLVHMVVTQVVNSSSITHLQHISVRSILMSSCSCLEVFKQNCVWLILFPHAYMPFPSLVIDLITLMTNIWRAHKLWFSSLRNFLYSHIGFKYSCQYFVH